jgi:hypothetical protein
MLVSCLVCSLILSLEATYSSKMSLVFHLTTWLYIPEELFTATDLSTTNPSTLLSAYLSYVFTGSQFDSTSNSTANNPSSDVHGN